MKVASTKDAILCLALFRPAAMDSGHTDLYLSRRASHVHPDYIHPVFEKATRETYGVFVLQDQVIDVLRGVGMPYEDVNDLLKAVKASNERIAEAERTFDRLEKVFIGRCKTIGMAPTVAYQGWEHIRGFSDYGFNKAHATSYGVLSYRMAYLKAHWPLEFMCAVLMTWVGDSTKERLYTQEARRLGFAIIKADVTTSKASWTIDRDRNGLRRGLLSIKGVGVNAARELADHQPYGSVDDIIAKCSPSIVTGGKSWKKEQTLNGVLGKLRDSGALRTFGLD